MAINKKLIHFEKRENFDTRLANNEINDTSIVFIQDTGELWTHGQFFCTTATNLLEAPSLLTVGDTIAVQIGDKTSNYIVPPAALKGRTMYECITDTADTRGHWTGTIPGVTELYDGLVIHVRFTTSYYGNGEGYNTLDINNLGPKLIWYRYGSILTSHWGSNAEVTLTYRTTAGSYKVSKTTGELTNGTTYTDGWVADYAYYSDTNWLATAYYFRFKVHESGYLGRYMLVMKCPNGTITGLSTNTTTNGNTLTNKPMFTGPLLIDNVFYYRTTTAFAANAVLTSSTDNQMCENYGAIDARYTFNCGTTLTANKPFFIVGNIGEDGYFHLDVTQPWALEYPTTEDNKIYIYVGYTYSTYQIWLDVNNPAYIYKNGKLLLYSLYAAETEWANIIGKPSTFTPSTHTHPYTDLTGSTTTANLAIVSNGTANGWTLKTLGSHAFDSTEYVTINTNLTITGTKTFNIGKWKLAASESNEIVDKQWGNSTYYKADDSAVVTNLSAITRALRFRWYDTYYNLGIIRAGSSAAYGFGIGVENSDNTHVLDLFRVSTTGTYILGNLALHESNYTSYVTSAYVNGLVDGKYVGGYISYLKSGYLVSHPEAGNGAIIPFLYNDIAFLVKRGGNVSIYSTTDTDLTLDALTVKKSWGSGTTFDAMFNASPSYYNFGNDNATEMNEDGIIIDITLHRLFRFSNNFYIDFGTGAWGYKKIDILLKNSNLLTEYVSKVNEGNTNEAAQYFVRLSHSVNGTSGFDRMRIHLYDRTATGGVRIAQIGLIEYSSAGHRNTTMSLGIDDPIYRGITPASTNTYNLGSASARWSSVYTTVLNASGALTASSSVTFTGLAEGTSDIVEGIEFLTSYSGPNGFNSSGHIGQVYRRPVSKLYNYLKGKFDTLYLGTSGNANTATEFASAQSITLTGDTTGTASSKAGWDIETTTKYLTGASSGSTALATTAMTTAMGNGKVTYYYKLTNNTTGLFATNNNANSMFTFNKHDGNYDSQLGFSSNGNIYYRNFNGEALNTTKTWKQIAFTDSNITGQASYAANVGSAGTLGTNYVAASKVIAACNWYDAVTGSDTDSVINRWDEIVNFVAGFEETPDLATYLANNYLAKTGNSTASPMTGTIYVKDVNPLVLQATNLDLDIWRVSGNTTAWDYNHGFYLRYNGTGLGNNNSLSLWANNITGNDIEVYQVKLDGILNFLTAPTINGTAISLAGHTHDERYVKLSSTEQTIESTISSYSKGIIEFYRSSGDHIAFIQFANKVNNAKRVLGAIGFYSGGVGKLQYRSPSAEFYDILHGNNINTYVQGSTITLSTTAQTFLTVKTGLSGSLSNTTTTIKLPATDPYTSARTPTSHTHYATTYKDSRNDVMTPATAAAINGIAIDFKVKATGVNAGTGLYCGLVTFDPYSDVTGGYPLQMGFNSGLDANNTNELYIRTAKNVNTWNDWRTVITSTNIENYLTDLNADTVDSFHVSNYGFLYLSFYTLHFARETAIDGYPLLEDNTQPIYVKITTLNKFYTEFICFLVSGLYDNVLGTSYIQGYCRNVNSFFFDTVSYNGNKLLGIYLPGDNTDLYYLKFTSFNGTYETNTNKGTIYIRSNVVITSASIIQPSDETYSTVSNYLYNEIKVGRGGTNIWNTLIPTNSNTYLLGNSTYRWKSIYSINGDFSSSITANSFIKSGGTSSQFLKADGSVDTNTYATTSHNHDSTYLKLSGGTMTGAIAYGSTSSANDTTQGINFGTTSHIGSSTGLGIYSTGSIYIRPSQTSLSSVTNYGLVVSSTAFTYNNTNVSLEGHTHSLYVTSVGVTDDTTNHANLLRYVKNGTSTYFTVPFATNSTNATNATTANNSYLLLAFSGNEVAIGCAETPANSTNGAIYINYRSGRGGAVDDAATQVTHYYFGNRKGGTTGVGIVADSFIGNASSATKADNLNKSTLGYLYQSATTTTGSTGTVTATSGKIGIPIQFYGSQVNYALNNDLFYATVASNAITENTTYLGDAIKSKTFVKTSAHVPTGASSSSSSGTSGESITYTAGDGIKIAGTLISTNTWTGTESLFAELANPSSYDLIYIIED